MDAAAEVRPVGNAPRARWVLAIACALPIVCAFAPRDLWSPDEPRYGRVAHEMVATGDWMVPRFNGVPYPEKPPLVFWLQAVVETVTGGRTPVGARLPAACLAALATWLLARFASKRLGGEEVGDTAAILFATTALVLWNSSRAGLDLPMLAFGLLALEGGASAVLDKSWGGAVGFGAGIGLGLLTKGPHALYLPIAALLGGAVWAGRGRALLSPRLGVGLVLALAICAAWLVPALIARGDDPTASGATYGERLLGQIGSRVSGEDEPHAHGPLFLLGLVFPMGLPWIAAAVVGLLDALRARRRRDPTRFGLGAAAFGLLVPLLLLSVPTSKRELYLIPPLAAAACLAAHAFHGGARREAFATARLAGVLAAVGAVACAAAPFVAGRLDLLDSLDAASGERLGRGLPFVGCLGAAAALAAGAWTGFRAASPAVAARWIGVGFALASAFVFLLVLPAYDSAKSTADIARVVDSHPRSVRFAIAATGDLTSLWNVDRPRADRIGADAAGLAAAIAPTAPPAVVLVKGSHWRDLPSRRTTAPADRALLARARLVWEGTVGGTAWVIVSNAPP